MNHEGRALAFASKEIDGQTFMEWQARRCNWNFPVAGLFEQTVKGAFAGLNKDEMLKGNTIVSAAYYLVEGDLDHIENLTSWHSFMSEVLVYDQKRARNELSSMRSSMFGL